MPAEPVPDLPLSPYRVLDLADEKGALCGRLLADMGADVIKVEPPGGDPSRRHGPFYHDEPDPERSLSWFAYNFNKRGVTLNLATADGQAIFRRLAATSGFIVESFPPGHLDGLGLGFEALRQANSRLVMVSITPFGQLGPRRDYKMDDMVAMASGGMMAITGDRDRAPLCVGVPIAFALASAQAGAGAMFAHHQRLRTGQGRHVDVAIQEAIVDTVHMSAQFWGVEKTAQKRGDHAYGGHHIINAYPVKDGFVAHQLYWGKGPGTRVRGLQAWMADEGYQADVAKVDFNEVTGFSITQRQVDGWQDEVAAFLSRFTKAETYAKALRHRVFLFPVNSPKDLAEDPQLLARKFFHDVLHPELDATIRYPGPFFRFSEAAPPILRRAPLIGEHNVEVYKEEMGYSREELRTLKAAGGL